MSLRQPLGHCLAKVAARELKPAKGVSSAVPFDACAILVSSGQLEFAISLLGPILSRPRRHLSPIRTTATDSTTTRRDCQDQDTWHPNKATQPSARTKAGRQLLYHSCLAENGSVRAAEPIEPTPLA